MKRFPYDLHTHSDYSDGDFPPEHLFRAAKRYGMQGLVLTDHNTTRSMGLAVALAKKYRLETLEGIEISARHRGGVAVHLLAYSYRFDKEVLERALARTQRGYRKRIQEYLRKIGESGLPKLSMSEVLAFRPHAPFPVKYDLLRALSTKARVPVQQLLPLLNSGGALYVPYGRWAMTPKQVLRLVARAGGVAILAHPGELRKNFERKFGKRADTLLERFVARLAEGGLRGLELCHINHRPKDERFFRPFVKKYRFIATGGSDYHGRYHHPRRLLGKWGTKEGAFRRLQRAARL